MHLFRPSYQIAARCLGIDISLIRILDTATDKVPNASPTAASVGSDVNGLAVQNACETIMERLRPLRDQLPNKEAGWKVKKGRKREWIDDRFRQTFLYNFE